MVKRLCVKLSLLIAAFPNGLTGDLNVEGSHLFVFMDLGVTERHKQNSEHWTFPALETLC